MVGIPFIISGPSTFRKVEKSISKVCSVWCNGLVSAYKNNRMSVEISEDCGDTKLKGNMK